MPLKVQLRFVLTPGLRNLLPHLAANPAGRGLLLVNQSCKNPEERKKELNRMLQRLQLHSQKLDSKKQKVILRFCFFPPDSCLLGCSSKLKKREYTCTAGGRPGGSSQGCITIQTPLNVFLVREKIIMLIMH